MATKITAEGYSVKSNAKRAAKSAGLAEGTYSIVPGGAGFLVQMNAPATTEVVQETPAQPYTGPEGANSPATETARATNLALAKALREDTAKRKEAKKAAHKAAKTPAKSKKKAAPPAAKKARKGTANNKGGYKIEKNRTKRHDITKRSTGTNGQKMWALYDKLLEKAGGMDKLVPATAIDAAIAAGFKPTSAGIAFYRWRRFNGQRGRVNLKKAQK